MVRGATAPAGDSRLKAQPVDNPRDFDTALTPAAPPAHGTHLALLPGHSRLSPDALAEIKLTRWPPIPCWNWSIPTRTG